MTSKLRAFYRSVIFGDSLLGLFINPFYISRSSLYHCIKKCSKDIVGGSLLDVGCGSKPYKGLFKVDEYIGLDIEESGHDHSTSEVDIFYDGNEIPFDNSKFDHVFASEVFEHVFNLDELLKEINRVTKKGGSLLITLPFVWDEHEEPYDFARYSSFGITDILKKHGYTVINLHKSTSYIGTIFQMFAAYISQVILPENRFIRIALTPFCVAPFNMIGIFLSYILPDNRKFYLNNIVYSIKDWEVNYTNKLYLKHC